MTFARRQLLLFALGAIILCCGFPASAQKRAKRSGNPRAVRRPAVTVIKIDTEGLKSLLKRDVSRPLLVNFWATWCDPCREEFPDLVKINAQYKSKGLDFIAVSLDDLSEIKTSVPRFLRQMRATMPAYLLSAVDPEPAIKLVDPNWSGALPATVLYNQQGEVVFKHFGRVNTKELRAAIEKLVTPKQAE